MSSFAQINMIHLWMKNHIFFSIGFFDFYQFKGGKIETIESFISKLIYSVCILYKNKSNDEWVIHFLITQAQSNAPVQIKRTLINFFCVLIYWLFFNSMIGKIVKKNNIKHPLNIEWTFTGFECNRNKQKNHNEFNFKGFQWDGTCFCFQKCIQLSKR